MSINISNKHKETNKNIFYKKRQHQKNKVPMNKPYKNVYDFYAKKLQTIFEKN